jgi:hypothetical protein
MRKLVAAAVAVGTLVALVPSGAEAAPRFRPGAPGIGDPYFPLDGNGGYDVKHYDLALRYDPATDVLGGVASIRILATQNLSSFDLDLVGLDVRSVTVGGRAARWRRDGQELVVTPRKGLRSGREFTAVVRYDGIPEPVDEGLGLSGFIATEDGVFVAGQPHGAATWFPVNDHPKDTATYTVKITAPTGLDAISNGRLAAKKQLGAWTRWTWRATDPMASYLLTMAIGNYDTRSYTADGVRYVDAVASSLLEPLAAPSTGTRVLWSQQADASYKRLTRTVAVPAGGATLSFDVTRDTEPDWDYLFVEARTAGADDWTTLPDANGHTAQDTGTSCPAGWLGLHPALAHYQTFDPGTATTAPSCAPTGTTGAWWAASGRSDGVERWSIDLGAYAGKQVEVSLGYASDESVQNTGVVVDDVVVSTGEGTTSFEDDGDTLDGWTVPGAPAGSPGNATDWTTTTPDAIPTLGGNALAALDRQPEILRFLGERFGRYPFKDAGGIVVDTPIGFALETQTRPIYSPLFFGDASGGDSVVVHELTHQWFGDDLPVARWQHIWLNEGFATYAEWMWAESEGFITAQEIFDFFASIPADDDFWTLTIGDPGPTQLFDSPVYNRGAMTLHALRTAIGDDAFFRLLRTWVARNSGKNVTTAQFVTLAEGIAGRDLDAFFDTWLLTGAKPAGIEPAPAAAAARGAAPAGPRTVEPTKRVHLRR